jgi:quercetin dioxygenase-like cupin family protein
MQVVKKNDVSAERATSDLFMGEVHRTGYVDNRNAKSLRLGLVSFKANARTKWHTHTFEQGLYIVEGKGIVATEAAEHVVEPGDFVVVPLGEKHWHGGSATTAMAHISIGGQGETTTLEPVTEVKTKV